jgi:hypothetical protein
VLSKARVIDAEEVLKEKEKDLKKRVEEGTQERRKKRMLNWPKKRKKGWN